MSFEEYEALIDNGLAEGYYANDCRILLPGMAWFCPWMYDPTGEREASNKHVFVKKADRGSLNYLSKHYWNDWANIRAPICVVCPNGETWEIDRKSRNGDGWKVTGELPHITCTPSIVVDGYHGFLRNGEFTNDLENRGADGIARVMPEKRKI